MANSIKRRSISVYIPDEELENLDEVCGYLDISRTKFIRLVTDYLYHKLILEDFEINLDEIAMKYDVGYGVLVDIFSDYE